MQIFLVIITPFIGVLFSANINNDKNNSFITSISVAQNI